MPEKAPYHYVMKSCDQKPEMFDIFEGTRMILCLNDRYRAIEIAGLMQRAFEAGFNTR